MLALREEATARAAEEKQRKEEEKKARETEYRREQEAKKTAILERHKAEERKRKEEQKKAAEQALRKAREDVASKVKTHGVASLTPQDIAVILEQVSCAGNVEQ